MDELLTVTVTRNEAEAEIVCGLLRGEGIRCMQRITNLGFVTGGEVASSGGGVRAVMVRAEDYERACTLLRGAMDDAALEHGSAPAYDSEQSR
jgi:hypothetical protein